jgi:hypothetical protein
MIPRAAAAALALLVLASSLPAATRKCCSLRATTERMIMSPMDCCETMLECPIAPEAAVAAASTSMLPAPRGSVVLCQQPSVSLEASLLTRPVPGPTLTALLSTPPLYRLHSQLLI